MNKRDTYIKELGLEPHIEGGWFKEVYASDYLMADKVSATSIYFLLDEDNFSAFHRLTSDELWFYHDGNGLIISVINPEGELIEYRLGKNLEMGEVPYVCVNKNSIFGSAVNEGFALVSCVVIPGFDYADFELFSRQELLTQYPQHETIIRKLTR